MEHQRVIFQGLDQISSVLPAVGQVPATKPFEFAQSDGGLHLGHSVIETDPVMDVHEFGFKLQ